MSRVALIGLGLLALTACPDRQPLQVPELEYGLDQHWPARSTYPGVGQGRVLVTNSLEDSVSLFDVTQLGQAAFPELARAPVGLLPPEIEGVHHAAIDPGGQYYYVGISNFAPGTGTGPHGAHGNGTADGHVLKVRASDNIVVGEVRVDRNPGDLVLSPDGKRAYASHFDLLRINEVEQRGGTIREMDSRLAILDTATMTRIAMIPACAAAHGVVVNADETRAYLACASDEVAVVDLVSPNHPVTRIPVIPGGGDPTSATHLPYALELSKDGRSLYVNCLDGHDLHVLDTESLTIDPSRHVQLTASPYFGSFSKDGSTLFLPHQSPDGVAYIDVASSTVTRDVSLPANACEKPHALILSADGSLGLIACEGNHRDPGTLLVLDLADQTVVSSTKIGVYPDFVGLIPGTAP